MPQKRLIFIFGNIASGKSTLITHLTQNNPYFAKYAVFQKDVFRDGTLATEHRIKSDLIKTLQKNNFVILESTGGGKFANIIKREIRRQKFKVFRIYIQCPPLTILKRLDSRPQRVFTGYKLEQNLIWEIADNLPKMRYNLILKSAEMPPEKMAQIAESQIINFFRNE